MKSDNITSHSKRLSAQGDIFSPDQGHRTRFESRLKERNGSGHNKSGTPKYRLLRYILTAAAVIAVAMTFAILQKNRDYDSPGDSGRLSEVTGYYNSLLSAQVQEIRALLPDLDMETRTEILHDLKQLETIDIRSLDKENILSEQAIEGVVYQVYTSYRHSLENLEGILKYDHKDGV